MHITALAAFTPDDWAELSQEERREIYSTLVASVLVSGDEVGKVRLD